MKILILSTKLPYPAIDGGAIATLGLARGLATEGIEVDMLTFNTSKHYTDPKEIPGEISNAIQIIPVDLNTKPGIGPAIKNLLFSRKPYISERFRSEEFKTRLQRLLTDQDYDIVQLEGPYLSHYIPIIRKHSGAIIALRAHNTEHEIWERRWKNTEFKPGRWYYRNLSGRIRRLEKKTMQSIDCLVAISDRDRKNLLGLSAVTESITIPAGLDAGSYDPPGLQSGKDIGFIGALDWAPNQEGLSWFISNVLPALKGEGIKLHVAGRNAPDSFVKKLQDPDIIYHGEVESAGEYLCQHSIMIVPLLSGSGIRIKILEGMALGRCIISTSRGAEGIPAEDGRHILIADTPELFAAKILQAVNDPSLAKDIAGAGRKLVEEKFDTFAVASNLAAFYRKIT